MHDDETPTITISTCPACSCMFSCPFPCPRCGSSADSTITERALSREERELHALQQTYPGYRIVRTHAGWFAARLAPTTAQQRAAGVIGSFGRKTAEALATALARDDEILHLRRHA